MANFSQTNTGCSGDPTLSSIEPLNRVMCIDDDPGMLQIAKICLQDMAGLTVELCSSGREAVDKSAIFRPQLVLVDMMMPDMDGVETVNRLRSVNDFGELPVILVTAVMGPAEANNCHQANAIAVISKPFDPLCLAERVQSEWLALQESKARVA